MEDMPSPRPPIHDPEIEQAMEVYDNLNERERRQIFLSLYRAVTAFSRSSDIDYLAQFAKSIKGMVVLESKHPEVRDQIRNAPRTARDAGGAVDFAEVRKLLRE